MGYEEVGGLIMVVAVALGTWPITPPWLRGVAPLAAVGVVDAKRVTLFTVDPPPVCCCWRMLTGWGVVLGTATSVGWGRGRGCLASVMPPPDATPIVLGGRLEGLEGTGTVGIRNGCCFTGGGVAKSTGALCSGGMVCPEGVADEVVGGAIPPPDGELMLELALKFVPLVSVF